MSQFLVLHSSSARRVVAVAAIMLILPLSGCESLRKAAGIEKAPPDEFAVLNRAPLTLPPDYTLRPPQGGALRPQETQPTELARQTVFRAGETNGPAVPGQASLSSGEMALLRQAGAGSAPSDIRQLVNQDNTKTVQTDQGFVNELLFWKDKPVPGDAIDPVQEARRLQENAAAGKPAEAQADGAVPGGAAPPPVVQAQTQGQADAQPAAQKEAQAGAQASNSGETATIERKKSSGFFGSLF